VKTGIQTCPCEYRDLIDNGFLLEFIPVKIGAGMSDEEKHF
jgi:hypothetical protein